MTNAAAVNPQPMTKGFWQAILDESVTPLHEPPIRRKLQRYPVHSPCTLHFQDHGLPVAQPLNLTNVSVNGIMGKSPSEMETDTPVTIHVSVEDRQFVMHGTVAHCTATIGGFKVGIELALPLQTPPCAE